MYKQNKVSDIVGLNSVQFCHLFELFLAKTISHCSWKPQMDGLKNAETSSMDFYTQLVTLKGWKKQFENLWADF